MDSSCSFVNGGQICVEVTWVGSTSRNFFSSSGYFSERIGVSTHIGHNDEHMQFSFIGQILGCREGQSWGNNSFDGGVISQIQEQDHPLHRTVLLEVSFEETGHLHVNTHSSKNDTEVFI